MPEASGAEPQRDHDQAKVSPIGLVHDLREVSDEELAAPMCAGDAAAFQVFYDRYVGLVRRIAFRMLHDRSEAEDAAQTVFWDAYRALGRYDANKGTLRTWLLQYAYHRILNHKNALARKGFYKATVLESVEREQAETPKKGLLSEETTHAVRHALSLLTEDQRVTLQMVFLEGMEMADVAETLRQNVSNVRHHYYRGLKKLREILGPGGLSGEGGSKPPFL